jgi:two-component system, OmpR family, response regulator
VACRLEITAPKTILVCEDDSNLRTLVRLALGDGYRFVEAPDGQAVVELARTTRPDLILLDLMLPGKSGFDVLSDLRREEAVAKTPVVVISAWSHSDVAVIRAGADRFVSKPFDPEELRNVVLDLIGADERIS